MKKGPSLYYASDKNIFDALNQSKVDQDTIQAMFRRRNTICSKHTPRDELARFFSRLTHDALDHRDLSARLGIASRRERVTAVDLKGSIERDSITRSVDSLKERLAREGDTVHVTTNANSTTLAVRYSVIDYKRSEFSQLQHREGYVEIIREKDGLVVRSTKADHIDGVRDELIRAIELDTNAALERSEISLFHHKSHAVRSQFFYDLMMELPDYVRRDVSDVFVYKSRPDENSEDEHSSGNGDEDSYVERVLLRGKGVSQSEILRELTRERDYYIIKVGWLATERLGRGFGFDIEATFANPKDCTGFSYLLRGVHELGDDGKLVKHRRGPTTGEIDAIARAIESKARELVRRLDGVSAARFK